MIRQKFTVVYIFLAALTFFFLTGIIGKSGEYQNRFWVSKTQASALVDVKISEPEMVAPLPRLDAINYDWMRPIDYSHSHPFENMCRYPVLNKQEPDLAHHVSHYRTFNCTLSSPRKITVFQDKNNEMYIHQLQNKKGSYKCYAAKLLGTLKPAKDTIEIEPYFEVPIGKPFVVGYDQFVLECFQANNTIRSSGPYVRNQNTVLESKRYVEKTDAVYRNAFNWVPPKPSVKPPPSNVPKKYSIVILALESISRTQFLRHMPSTFKIMQDLGFNFFTGFTKVGDNSLINLNTLLTGHVYKAKDRGFNGIISNDTEIPQDMKGIETFPTALFTRAKYGGYVTMWNDEIGLRGYGLYHYYHWNGFQKPIANYYYRPFYQFMYSVKRAAKQICDDDGPFVPRYFRPLSAFSTRYANKTHFSFNFISRWTHENPSNLENYDNILAQVLNDFKLAGVFDNTVVVIMGDHGNRIDGIQYKYSGRIEERTPFLGIYLPFKFSAEYPEKVKNLKINQNRLISHFDIFETLSDVLDITLDESKHPQTKTHGISLFDKIPRDRDCHSALIPPNFCLCMEDPSSSTSRNLTETNYHAHLNQTLDIYFQKLTTIVPCIANISTDNLSKPTFWTISKMVRSGVRYMKDNWNPMKREAAELEMTSDISVQSTDGRILKGNAKIRLFWMPNFYKMEMNVAPLVSFDSCKGVFVLENVCQCFA